VGGQPFLAYLLDLLVRAEVRRALLCTGHMGDQVQAHFGDSYRTLSLIYSPEPTPLGTGGALRLALPLIDSEVVLALNGDSYCEADLRLFWGWHGRQSARATLLLTRMADTGRYGQVQVQADGTISGFSEKQAHSGPGWINAGVYLIARDWLSDIPSGRTVSLEHEVFPAWVGHGLYGWQGGGRFLDIGTPDAYAAAQTFFASVTADER
jgi:NDP-sugar pyrophosphorylase family protein